jgi:hypothetical protein
LIWEGQLPHEWLPHGAQRKQVVFLFDMTPLVTVSIISPSCATMTRNIEPSPSDN